MNKTGYFQETPVNDWQLAKALEHYHRRKPASLLDHLLSMKLDLERLQEARKTSKNITRMSLDVKVLLEFVLTPSQSQPTAPDTLRSPASGSGTSKPGSPSTAEPSQFPDYSPTISSFPCSPIVPTQTPPSNINIGRIDISDSVNNFGSVGTINQAKPIDRLFDETAGSSTESGVNPLKEFNRNTVDDVAAHSKKYIHMATSNAISNNEEIKQEYMLHKRRHDSLGSLKDLDGSVAFLKTALASGFSELPRTIWSYDKEHLRSDAKAMVDIMQYVLTDFHRYCLSPSPVTKHERTAFIDLLIPALAAFAKVSGLVNFSWCEKELLSNKLVRQNHCNFVLKNVARLMDGLATLSRSSSLSEVILVEASSGRLDEDIPHNVENVIKLLECSTSSLRYQAERWKKASYRTLVGTKVFCLQAIRDKLTLSATSIYSPSMWKHVELASAQIPAVWNDRMDFAEFFDLLAVLL
ncbi:hypothetical protein EC973_003953, partial [Apophysomyces ossiformis]